MYSRNVELKTKWIEAQDVVKRKHRKLKRSNGGESGELLEESNIVFMRR